MDISVISPQKFEQFYSLLLEIQANSMALTVDQLYKAHAALQTQWEGVVDFTDVSELDHFYSDGMSKNAILKIVLRYPNDAECIRVIYIFPDGGYSEVFEQPINRMILVWMASVL